MFMNRQKYTKVTMFIVVLVHNLYLEKNTGWPRPRLVFVISTPAVEAPKLMTGGWSIPPKIIFDDMGVVWVCIKWYQHIGVGRWPRPPAGTARCWRSPRNEWLLSCQCQGLIVILKQKIWRLSSNLRVSWFICGQVPYTSYSRGPECNKHVCSMTEGAEP
jgi:hypothetical protein